ncbi:MAG: hypothetical protein KKA07_18575 [Bacteroidetes bacterium]|nr:hypothetical protein [Bacteroidota bacterium]MBU1721077.1 hypothetical protein [Bacteroidota bacterium]
MKKIFVISILLFWTIVGFGQNVGFGTLTPGEKLEVNGKVKLNDDVMSAVQQTFDGGTSNLLKINNSAGYGLLGSISSNWSYFGSDLSKIIFSTTVFEVTGTFSSWDVANLSFKTNGTTRMTILNSNGNAGIGITNPSQKLDVSGDMLVQGNNVYGTGNLILHGAGGGYVEAKSNSSTYGLIIREYNSGDWGNVEVDANGLNFGYLNDASQLLIKTNGNVGIGNTSASYKLEVSGDLRLSGDLLFGDSYTRTQTRHDAGAMGGRSGFYQTWDPTPFAANWPVGAASWWHLIDVRHSNITNNYAMQFSASFWGTDLYFRKTNNSASAPWYRVKKSTENPRPFTRVTFPSNTTTTVYSDTYINIRYNTSTAYIQFSPNSGYSGWWDCFSLSEGSAGGRSPESMAVDINTSAGSWYNLNDVDASSSSGPGASIWLTKEDSNAYPIYHVILLTHGSYTTVLIETK